MSTPTASDQATRLACLGVLAVLAFGCSDPGPAEQAGERLDDSIEAMGEGVEEAQREVSDAIDPPGAGERAGRAVDDLVDEGEEAAEKMKEAVED